jgi:hypothetical protein
MTKFVGYPTVQLTKDKKPNLWFDGSRWHSMYVYFGGGTSRWEANPELMHRSWEDRVECFEHAAKIQEFVYCGARYAH